MIKKLVKYFLGKQWGQNLFQWLFWLGLKGMNFGGGSDYRDSGEAWVLKYIAQSLANQSIMVFDVGANIGGYAQLVAQIMPKAQVLAFEPAYKTFLALQNNLEQLHLVKCFNLAFGNYIGQSVLFSNYSESGLSSVYNREGLGLYNQESIQMNTLDNFCAQQAISQIDFLKLDVEGNEYKVLEGASNMLKGNKIKFIQFEFGGTDIDARVFFRDFYFLLSPKYNIYRILKNGLYPIKVYKESEEIFITTNYLAILKGN